MLINSNIIPYWETLKVNHGELIDKHCANHIDQESISGFSKEYIRLAQMKYFFVIFYGMKSKLSIVPDYDWDSVEDEYDLVDLVKKLYCNELTFKQMLDIFEIDPIIGDSNILVTIERIDFELREGGETFTQLYRE